MREHHVEPLTPPPPPRGQRVERPTPAAGAADVDAVARVAERIRDNVEKVIEGKPEVVSAAIVVLLAEGHLLIEDIPGVGKTMLSKALARSIDSTVRRIQFTPDLLPSDITGVSVYDQSTRSFEFRPGAIFANVVIGDEINRASPKTQSALLECMAERQVSVDSVTYQLESPFMVIATQNPVEMEGTYPLPEAQRDRFLARVSIGYPVPAAEIAMLSNHGATNPLDDLEPVTDTAEVRKLCATVADVHVSEAVQRYAVALTSATRQSPELVLGASPRATLHLVRAAKARAAMHRRDYVLPDDLLVLLQPVLAHRLLPGPEATVAGRGAHSILADIANRVPVPDPASY
ncbi:AAA family ATPase [Nocardioides sp. zg-536]|uniref:AAA family ATPase n=1 Tax=Nocardioides faecalis TaxID=2803858 RepID=A0A938Y775_9ACTN|nr:AAA family ATPase [Nocardioides faecalis]MBM9460469.1 AAA family ATPase [Nocardioides faecalis]MBS4752286.1 AAA family ATPase [Nocardioides faecalis]QVI57592.1 AAA family ATPase [Nocardioides faecalis]